MPWQQVDGELLELHPDCKAGRQGHNLTTIRTRNRRTAGLRRVLPETGKTQAFDVPPNQRRGNDHGDRHEPGRGLLGRIKPGTKIGGQHRRSAIG